MIFDLVSYIASLPKWEVYLLTILGWIIIGLTMPILRFFQCKKTSRNDLKWFIIECIIFALFFIVLSNFIHISWFIMDIIVGFSTYILGFCLCGIWYLYSRNLSEENKKRSLKIFGIILALGISYWIGTKNVSMNTAYNYIIDHKEEYVDYVYNRYEKWKVTTEKCINKKCSMIELELNQEAEKLHKKGYSKEDIDTQLYNKRNKLVEDYKKMYIDNLDVTNGLIDTITDSKNLLKTRHKI